MRTHYHPETEALTDWLGGFQLVRGLSRKGERIALAAHGHILAGTLIWAYGSLWLDWMLVGGSSAMSHCGKLNQRYGLSPPTLLSGASEHPA